MRTHLIKRPSGYPSLLPWLSLFFWLPLFAQAQNAPRGVADWLDSYRVAAAFAPSNLLLPIPAAEGQNRPIQDADYFELDKNTTQNLLTTNLLSLTLRIPWAGGPALELELVQADILAPGFSVGTLGEQVKQHLPISPGLHYRGVIKGRPNSIAAVSIFADEVMGMICDAQGTLVLGKMTDGSERIILYKASDMERPIAQACESDLLDHEDIVRDNEQTSERGVGCKTVQIYFECDYQMYLDRSSNTQNVTNYVTGLFNQVATLYANDNIGVAISEIFVWASPDPHRSQSGTSGVLNSFRSARGTNFNGHLAHFLSTRSLGGGVAYVDVICAKSYAYGVSGITNSFQNVPTYSWSVEVLTHELGHNLGSWHTQSCNWPGGAIDNCVTQEGSCAPGPPPVNGGTIMSYCHLTNHGINFNHGFGPKPGDRIRSRVLAANCLPQTGTAPNGLSASNISGTSVTLNWGAVPGATAYSVSYKTAASTTWLNGGSSTSTTLNLNGLALNTDYQWQVKTDCSAFSATANFKTGTGGGTGNCNSPTNLNTAAITTTSAVLSWAAVSGASTYTVQYKTNGSSTWTTGNTLSSTNTTLSGLAAATTYNWQVKANCSGYAAGANFTTGNNPINCTAPIGLGISNLTATSVRLNWTANSGANSYTVQFKNASSSVWTTAGNTSANTYNLSNLAPNTTYQWRVKANCSAYSISSSFATPNSGGGQNCPAPTGPVNVSVGNTWAVIRWNPSVGAVNYTLQIRTSNSVSYTTLGTVGSTQVTLNGMAPNTLYFWRVKANCSNYSADQPLQALGNTETPTTGRTLELAQLRVSPNPATDWLQVQFGGIIPPKARLAITDASGRQLLEQGFMLEQQQVDVSALPNGLYFLSLFDSGLLLGSEPFIKCAER